MSIPKCSYCSNEATVPAEYPRICDHCDRYGPPGSVRRMSAGTEPPPAVETVVPVCPYCNAAMRPTKFTGYYDTLYYWACDCEELPEPEVRFGEYAR